MFQISSINFRLWTANNKYLKIYVIMNLLVFLDATVITGFDARGDGSRNIKYPKYSAIIGQQ